MNERRRIEHVALIDSDGRVCWLAPVDYPRDVEPGDFVNLSVHAELGKPVDLYWHLSPEIPMYVSGSKHD